MRLSSPEGRAPVKRILSVTVLLSVATAVSAATPGVRPEPGATGPASAPAAPSTYTVTLVTGDVVTVHGDGPGCPVVSVSPASRRRSIWRECGRDGHVRVIPTDVAPLVR